MTIGYIAMATRSERRRTIGQKNTTTNSEKPACSGGIAAIGFDQLRPSIQTCTKPSNLVWISRTFTRRRCSGTYVHSMATDQQHWDSVWSTKRSDEVSWYQRSTEP